MQTTYIIIGGLISCSILWLSLSNFFCSRSLCKSGCKWLRLGAHCIWVFYAGFCTLWRRDCCKFNVEKYVSCQSFHFYNISNSALFLYRILKHRLLLYIWSLAHFRRCMYLELKIGILSLIKQLAWVILCPYSLCLRKDARSPHSKYMIWSVVLSKAIEKARPVQSSVCMLSFVLGWRTRVCTGWWEVCHHLTAWNMRLLV